MESISTDGAAKDLNVTIGDKVSVSYYTITTQEEYITETTSFLVKGIVPIDGLIADTDIIPQFPGIHEQKISQNGIRLFHLIIH